MEYQPIFYDRDSGLMYFISVRDQTGADMGLVSDLFDMDKERFVVFGKGFQDKSEGLEETVS